MENKVHVLFYFFHAKSNYLAFILGWILLSIISLWWIAQRNTVGIAHTNYGRKRPSNHCVLLLFLSFQLSCGKTSLYYLLAAEGEENKKNKKLLRDRQEKIIRNWIYYNKFVG